MGLHFSELGLDPQICFAQTLIQHKLQASKGPLGATFQQSFASVNDQRVDLLSEFCAMGMGLQLIEGQMISEYIYTDSTLLWQRTKWQTKAGGGEVFSPLTKPARDEPQLRPTRPATPSSDKSKISITPDLFVFALTRVLASRQWLEKWEIRWNQQTFAVESIAQQAPSGPLRFSLAGRRYQLNYDKDSRQLQSISCRMNPFGRVSFQLQNPPRHSEDVMPSFPDRP